jgi:GDP-L-fucose synthase
MICARVGYDFNAIQFDTSRYVGARSKCLAIDKLRKIMPKLKLTPLEQGLNETIDWFLREGKGMLSK